MRPSLKKGASIVWAPALIAAVGCDASEPSGTAGSTDGAGSAAHMRWTLLAVLGLLCGCSTSGKATNDTKAAPSASATPAAGHAPGGVKPGSHEDWCGEHAVPESQCTRCNKSLIPAFKATGDWCAEHDVPESQRLKCNPDKSNSLPSSGARERPPTSVRPMRSS